MPGFTGRGTVPVTYLGGLILVVCLLCPLAVAPQQAPPPAPALDRLVEIHARRASLADILQDMATGYGVPILADGWPLRQTADIEFRGTLREALDRVAESFDYTWSLSRGGVVLLTRRFKNPDERPQLNLPELRQTVKDMLTALPPVEAAPDHDRWGEMIIALADTLTPAQTQALRNGRRLAASDLSPTQQSLLERIILTRGYGVPRGVWERLFFQLDNMPTSVVRAADPSPNVPAAGQARKLRYVLHIARSKSGPSVETRLGQLEKEGKP